MSGPRTRAAQSARKRCFIVGLGQSWQGIGEAMNECGVAKLRSCTSFGPASSGNNQVPLLIPHFAGTKTTRERLHGQQL